MSYLLHETLSRSAQKTPEKTALVDRDRQVTYEELDRLTNRVAQLLVAEGVSKGDRVGILAPKSLEAVAAAYGIMKAGAVYVPLDPEAPVDRITFIVDNADIHLVVSVRDREAVLAHTANGTDTLDTVVFLDPAADGMQPDLPGVTIRTRSDVDDHSGDITPVRTIDLDLALMLYTSGSTGAPKGVMLSHVNVMTFVRWAVEEFDVTAVDRLSQFAPLHFDLSTFDLYGAALAGATVHLAPRTTSMFPMEIRRFIENNEISVVYAVPSSLIMLTERAKLETGDLPSLRTILFAGEVFPTKYLSRLMRFVPHVEFANLFGPTETNVCTYYRVPDPPSEDAPPISIGKAIRNVETVVVKKDGTVARPGEVGELQVRGPTVMSGYWGDAERTAKSRMANPFSDGLTDPVYKTGDLVIEEDDGNYTFLGRKDNQIKSRGYRIELGDIESAMYGHHQVVECAAVAVPDEAITNRIMAYVVVSEDLEAGDLTTFVSDRIPKYMVPDKLHLVDVLPKTSTGKIDRQALLESAIEKESK